VAPESAGNEAPHRAADILAQRLPTVPKKEENAAPAPAGSGTAGAQPTPPKNNGVNPGQQPDQAGSVVKKSAATTGEVNAKPSPTPKLSRPQPQAGDTEKPPR
jgi:hypothetical protein